MVMEKLSEVFYKGISFEQENIIRSLNVNHEAHKFGIINIAKSIEPNFKVNENNKGILNLLLFYFTGNEMMFNHWMNEVCKKSGSLSKGILLIGGVGTGKSLLFKIFKQYTGQILRVNSYQYHHASEVIDEVNVNGVEQMEFYNNNYGNPVTCYIDDIASKNEIVKHYGTEYNVVEQLINIRYNVYSRHHKLTHASTNKYPAELKEIYEDRIVDRMKEMFNIIELSGISHR